MHGYDYDDFDVDLWGDVRHTKEAVRARATLLLYTLLISAPFIVLVFVGACICGLRPHEVTGVSCYNAMLTTLFVFDTLRNAAHACFEEARAERLVTYRQGIPVVDPAFRHHRFARLAFAVGGRDPQ
jgi:hypothetical protein